MKQQINEIKRMQLLAGVITESEYRKSLVNEEMELPKVGDKFSYEGDEIQITGVDDKFIDAKSTKKDKTYNFGLRSWKEDFKGSKLNELSLNEEKSLYADFDGGEKDIKSRFARSIFEVANEYPGLNINIPNYFDVYEDGDDFYAGPEESLEFFQTLPNEFMVTGNLKELSLDEPERSFKITKTGPDSFKAKEVSTSLNEEVEPDFKEKAKAFVNKHKNIIKDAVRFFKKRPDDYEESLIQTIYNFFEKELGEDWTTKISTPKPKDEKNYTYGWTDEKDEIFYNILKSILPTNI